MKHVSQLGYWGFEVSDLAAWERFARDVLGLQVEPGPDESSRFLRMDEYSWRIELSEGPSDDLAFAGWEVPDERKLGKLADQLSKLGVEVSEAPLELRERRRVQGLICCADPSGIPTELYWGPQMARTPFHSACVTSGFRAGDLGAGHMVVSSSDPEATTRFYTEGLGLRLSDYIDLTLGSMKLHLTFLHANARHHSVAFSGMPLPKRLHHFMLEVRAFDDVGAAHDRAIHAGVPIALGLGRHPNDRMFSFYARTPSGFEFEFGWGGREVDDETWRVRTYDAMSEWGHRPPGH